MKKNTQCRMCGSQQLRMFLQLGPQPLAGAFLTQDKVRQKDPMYPLDVYFCEDCKLVQLLDVVPKETMFSEYFYSPHPVLSEHYARYAEEVVERFKLKPDSLVVEFGSNDGTMLKYLTSLGPRGIGVEPAKNIAAIARERGVDTINDFFSEKVAREMVERHGKADAIIANNVFAHIDDLHEVMRGIRVLLKDAGIFVFENHYLLESVRQLQYDDIYHEHVCYYSLHPLVPFFKKYGLSVFDVKTVPTHGGSIRVYIGNPAHHPARNSVGKTLELEKKEKIDRLETYTDFAARVVRQRERLTGLLKSLKAQGKRIVGYGAPGRGNTMLNYCKIGTDILDYTTDENPLRQGKITPGMRIPVVSPERLRKEQPDYALMLAWSYMGPILKKEQRFLSRGGKFIVPLPEPKIL